MQCDWFITVPRGFLVELQFTLFDLEQDDACRYDFVEVKDLKSNRAKYMGKYCGSILPLPMTFSSNSIFVRFYSNNVITASGFQGVWHAKQPTIFSTGRRYNAKK